MANLQANLMPVIPLPRHPSTRIGDRERAHACDALAAHYGQGRLNGEKLDERLASVVGARTAADLRWTVVDLPPLKQEAPTPDPSPTPQATGWGLWDTLVLLILHACLGVAGLAFLALVFGRRSVHGAGTLSAIVARTGGAAAVHLAHRARDRQRAQAARP